MLIIYGIIGGIKNMILLYLLFVFYAAGPALIFMSLAYPTNDSDSILAVGVIWTLIAGGTAVYQIIKHKNEKDAYINAKIREQKNLADEQKDLAHLSGLEKMYQMDCIRIRKNAKAIQTLRENSQKMLKYSLESEKDWATYGGLASGIAGPVAGYVAAQNAIIDNQRIRAENEERRENQRAIEKWADAALAADRNSPDLSQLREKYITYYDLTSKQIFDKMNVRTSTFEIDEITGAITVTATIEKKFNSVETPCRWEKMCFDGSLKADIFGSNGSYAGSAYLVFPQQGFDKLSCTLSGICPMPQIEDTSYKIKITPFNLWELYTMDAKRMIEYDTDVEDQFWYKRFQEEEA